MARVYGNHKKRILIVFFVLGLLLTMLSLKLAWIQIVKGEEYTDKAIAQQTSDIPIEAKRGVIYDRNGKELATSATCYSVWARPPEIANTYTTEEKLDDICSKLAVVLDMKAKDVKEKLQKDQALIRIDKYLDRETCQKVRDLEIYGIEIAEDTKRFYPLGNFASQLLGSVNDDNVGRSGVEQE